MQAHPRFDDLGPGFEQFRNDEALVRFRCILGCSFKPTSFALAMRHSTSTSHQSALAPAPAPAPPFERRPPSPLADDPLPRDKSPSPERMDVDGTNDECGGGFDEIMFNESRSPTPAPQPGPIPAKDPLVEAFARMGQRGFVEPETEGREEETEIEKLERICGLSRSSQGEDGQVVDDLEDEAMAFLDRYRELDDNLSYYPFRDKATFLMALLLHLPRRPLSREQLKMILFVVKALGTPNAPTYNAVLTDTAKFVLASNEPPLHKHTGSMGNINFVKSLTAMVERDLLNPRLAPQLTFIPHRLSGLKGVYYGSELNTIPEEVATPMIRLPGAVDLYVDEVVKLLPEPAEDRHSVAAGNDKTRPRRSEFFFPKRWFQIGEAYGAEGLEVSRVGAKLQLGREYVDVMVDQFDLSNKAKQECNSFELYMVSDAATKKSELVPKVNPLRVVAAGNVVVSIGLGLHADDFGGSVASSHDTHYAVQITNFSLPRAARTEANGVRVYTVGRNSQVLELLEPLVADLIEAFENPRRMWNSASKEWMLVRLFPVVDIGDTIIQDIRACGKGCRATKPCRVCWVSGNEAFRKTPNGFEEFYSGTCKKRTARETFKVLEQMLRLAEKDKKKDFDALGTEKGIRDNHVEDVAQILFQENDETKGKAKSGPFAKKAKGYTATSQAEHMKQFREAMQLSPWHSPCLLLDRSPFHYDIHSKTAQDLLHVYALGSADLICTFTSKLPPAVLAQIAVRIDDVSTVGLGGTGESMRGENLVKKMGSMTGYERLWMVQIMPIVLAPLVKSKVIEQELLNCWIAVGTMGRLLYRESLEEDEIEAYLDDLDNAYRHLLAACAKIMPMSLVRTIKFHLLEHLIADILRWGLPRETCADHHEKMNGILRQDSIHSPRTAPSFDIGTRRVKQETLIHLLDGGYIKDGQGGYRQAGKGVLKIAGEARLRRMFGLGDTIKRYTTVPVPSKGKLEVFDLSEPKFARPLPDARPIELLSYSSFSSRNDVFRREEFAFYRLPKEAPSEFGFESREDGQEASGIVRIEAIVSFPPSKSEPDNTLSLSPFAIVTRVNKERHLARFYGLPSLQVMNDTGFLPLTSLVCRLSVHHDCIKSRCCIDTDGRQVRQERQETGIAVPAVSHEETGWYILNTLLQRSSHLVGDLYGPVAEAVGIKTISQQFNLSNDPSSDEE